MKRLFIFAFLFLFTSVISYSFDIPDRPYGRVNDYVGILSSSFKSKFELKLEEYEKRTKNKVVVVIIPSLDGENLESFSIRLAEKWKIGKKGLDNGVILLVALKYL